MRVGVVDALDCHLADVGAEELPRQVLRLLGRQTVLGRHFLPVDALEDENHFRHVRMDDLGDEQLGEVGNRAADDVRVVRFLSEVELGAQVHLELVHERLELEELRRLGALVQETDG